MEGTLFKEKDHWCVMTLHGNVIDVWEDRIPDGMKEYDKCSFTFHHNKERRGVNVYAIIIEGQDIHFPSP